MRQLLNTLYIQTQGSYLRLEGETVCIEVEKIKRAQVPLHHLRNIVVFGNVLLSPFLIQKCAEDGRTIVWLTERGRFKGRLCGSTGGNVLLRRTQHHHLDTAEHTLDIARRVAAGKLQNARVTLLRAAREASSDEDAAWLRRAAQDTAGQLTVLPITSTLDEIRGVEGTAARVYFDAFSCMIRLHRPFFEFTERSRRPPRDPINALLSFAYALLTTDCVSACESVGLDPQVGYLHALRPGRPSLALDLMEEFRSPVADRLVLTLINRGQIGPRDFILHDGGAVSLTEQARKALLSAYQERKKEERQHGFLREPIPTGLLPHVQARLLARHLRGDLAHYPPYLHR